MIVKPIAQDISAFDAKDESVFRFISKGGNQVVANRLIIKDNFTNSEIYNKKINSYRFEHIVPPHTLNNGKYYNFVFYTYDAKDNESLMSNIIPFRCYDTPLLKITNIPKDGIISNDNYIIEAEYNQEQKELLNYAKIILYDKNDNKLFQSENIYNDSIPPLKISYNLNKLEDNTTYHVSVLIETENNTIVESAKYTFTTRYFKPNLASLLELKNFCHEGYVQIKNNFLILGSTSNPPNIGENPKYLHDGKLDLTEKDTFLEWNDGFNIDDDFTLKYFVEKPNLGILTTLGKGKNRIEISLVEDYPYMKNSKEYCLELKCYNELSIPHFIYSNYIKNKNKIAIWGKKENNLFEVKLFSL